MFRCSSQLPSSGADLKRTPQQNTKSCNVSKTCVKNKFTFSVQHSNCIVGNKLVSAVINTNQQAVLSYRIAGLQNRLSSPGKRPAPTFPIKDHWHLSYQVVLKLAQHQVVLDLEHEYIYCCECTQREDEACNESDFVIMLLHNLILNHSKF